MTAQYFMKKGLLISFVIFLGFTSFLLPLSTTYAQTEETKTKEISIRKLTHFINN